LVFAQLQQRVIARFAVGKQDDGFNGLSDDKLPQSSLAELARIQAVINEPDLF
jgi:hypothetical protein